MCDVWKTYYAVPQALSHHVVVTGEYASAALADIKANISYDAFVKKYPHADKMENLLTMKRRYSDFKYAYTHFSTLQFEDRYVDVYSKDTSLVDEKLARKWAFEHYEKSDYQKEESVHALFFTCDFSTLPIPDRYAKMIQYADCMIDTNTQIFLGTTSEETFPPPNAIIDTFTEYVRTRVKPPDHRDYGQDYKGLDSAYEKWYADLDSNIRAGIGQTKEYQHRLGAAKKEAFSKKISTADLELYASAFLNDDSLLTLKRYRLVTGGCSQDDAPRYHALAIAKLSAEAVNWEIFLRSHLDVMNDNFLRAAESNATQAQKQTYLGELEALDIDVITLLFGISFKISNPAKNHYSGDIGRSGRAMTESKNKEQIEEQMAAMISDKALDDYNRIMMYFMYRCYLNFIGSDYDRKRNTEKLNAAIATLPSYYSDRISTSEESKRK